MSYIAKIYLTKMFPKKGEDCIHLEGDDIVITMNNVINPIENKDVPDNINEYFEINVNGQPLAGKNAPPEIFEKMKLVWVNKGKTYTAQNYKEAKGEVLPIGDKIKLYVPNHLGLKPGDNIKLEVKIHQDNPIAFSITRKLQ